MRLASVHLLVPCAVALAGCTSSPGLLPLPDDGVTLYDDLTSGSVNGAIWDDGEYRAVLADGAAVLSEAVVSPRPLHYATRLEAIPPGGGPVTTFKADVTLTGAAVLGTTVTRAGIELLFQPPAYRLQRPYDLTRALFARITLLTRGDGTIVATRNLIECLPIPDCGAVQAIGIPTFGANWVNDAPVALDTRYTLAISVEPDAKRFTFTLTQVGGDLALSQVFDVSDVTSATAPFTPDLSAESFQRAALLANVLGPDGGDGSVTARFDDVHLGVGGDPATPFDDFASGTSFDPARWRIGASSALATDEGLELHLEQADAPGATVMNLARPSATALQADVTVTRHASTGPGRIAAEIRSSLYNDGTNGSGIAPDVNAPGSQVGDLVAIVSMTDTDVSHAVIRCDSAVCSRFTFVEPPTSLGSVSPGTRHTLATRWDAERRSVLFQLDGNGAAAFDPVAAGYPNVGEPRSPCKRIAADAGPAGTGEPFGAGSAGSLTAIFANVRTN